MFKKSLTRFHAFRGRVGVIVLLVVASALVAAQSAFASEPGPSELSAGELSSLVQAAKEGGASIVSTLFAVLPYVLLIGVAMFVVGWLSRKFGFRKQSA